jgi:hypothetical protein
VRVQEAERRAAAVEAAVLEGRELESAGEREDARADRPGVLDEPRRGGGRRADAGVGRVRGQAECEPGGNVAREHRRDQAPGVGPARHEAPERGDERQDRRHHHRRDHQQPGGRGRERGNQDAAAGDGTAERGERCRVAPAAVVDVPAPGARAPEREQRPRREHEESDERGPEAPRVVAARARRVRVPRDRFGGHRWARGRVARPRRHQPLNANVLWIAL